MKVLVTGGSGFIGRHLVNHLVESKHQVAILDQVPPSSIKEFPTGISFYRKRIEDKSVEKVFAYEKPDCIFHLAAQVSVQKSMNDPFKDCVTNTLGTINLLNQCIKYNVKKIIFASSAAVYGEPIYLPIDELHSTNPLSYYARSKYTAESYIQLFYQQYGQQYSTLRFSNVYGPGQSAEGEAGVVSIFTDRILKNQTPIVFGGKQTRDFVYVKDVTRAMLSAAATKKSGTYNISSNSEISIDTLLRRMLKLAKRELKPVYQPVRKGEIIKSCLDNTKAIKELKWTPNMRLEEGLMATLEAKTASM